VIIIIIIIIIMIIGGGYKSKDSEVPWEHPYKLEWSDVLTLLPEEWIWTYIKPKSLVEDLWVGLRLGNLSLT
jgi:disulfide bond formation protein DsbB